MPPNILPFSSSTAIYCCCAKSVQLHCFRLFKSSAGLQNMHLLKLSPFQDWTKIITWLTHVQLEPCFSFLQNKLQNKLGRHSGSCNCFDGNGFDPVDILWENIRCRLWHVVSLISFGEGESMCCLGGGLSVVSRLDCVYPTNYPVLGRQKGWQRSKLAENRKQLDREGKPREKVRAICKRKLRGSGGRHKQVWSHPVLPSSRWLTFVNLHHLPPSSFTKTSCSLDSLDTKIDIND